MNPNKTTEQVVENGSEEFGVLRVECDPSLKRTFREKLSQSGFSSVSDAIRTLVRDFVSGRIIYKSGILFCQEKNQKIPKAS